MILLWKELLACNNFTGEILLWVDVLQRIVAAIICSLELLTTQVLTPLVVKNWNVSENLNNKFNNNNNNHNTFLLR